METIYTFNGEDITMLMCVVIREVIREIAKRENLNFEESMQKLETIANELEKGNLSLDESVNKFEEGMKLSKKCNDFLESAEKKITILINNGSEMAEEDFIPKDE